MKLLIWSVSDGQFLKTNMNCTRLGVPQPLVRRPLPVLGSFCTEISNKRILSFSHSVWRSWTFHIKQFHCPTSQLQLLKEFQKNKYFQTSCSVKNITQKKNAQTSWCFELVPLQQDAPKTVMFTFCAVRRHSVTVQKKNCFTKTEN